MNLRAAFSEPLKTPECPIEQRREAPAPYTDSVKHNTPDARAAEADAGLERIKHLEEQLVLAPANSPRRRTLTAAIRIEAHAYRKSLDAEQATATHDARPQTPAGLGSLNRTSRSAPRR